MRAGVVTVTPNPGLDLTYTLGPNPAADDDLTRAVDSRLEASGKGVNVSRALHAFGVRTCAVLPVGGATGRCLTDLLDAEGVPHRGASQRGDTRMNTSILRGSAEKIKVNGPGAGLSPDEQDALVAQVVRALQDHGADHVGGEGASLWLAVCGSLPPGADPSLISRLVDVAHSGGARCVVDASGAALSAALDAGADLVAPNQQELAYVEADLVASEALPNIAEVSGRIADRSGCAILLSLGAAGALYIDRAGTWHGSGPALRPVNTAGAGDALLAGWLAAAGSVEDRLATALRWGRSACLTASTVDPHPGASDDGEIAVQCLEHR